jgi:hypothetical protein
MAKQREPTVHGYQVISQPKKGWANHGIRLSVNYYGAELLDDNLREEAARELPTHTGHDCSLPHSAVTV